MKVYRDCLTSVSITNSGPIFLRVSNHPSIFNIPLTIIDSTDISPQCNVIGPSYNCINSGNSSNTAVKEYVLISDSVYIPGVPPTQGWAFTWSNCCRNGGISNLQLSFIGPGNPTVGMTLRAIMYPFNNQNAGNCYDSSPTFLEKPFIYVCASSPLSYNVGPIDEDGDSLSFEFANPLNYLAATDSFTSNSPTAIAFEPGFTYDSPFPGLSMNSNNIPVNLNPSSGEMTLKSYNVGVFVSVIKVTSFKCGQKVAEIFREIQTVMNSCGANIPPNINAVGIDTLGSITNFVDTVLAGDLVHFSIKGFDNEFLPNGSPQSISIVPNGSQFGANFTDPLFGCNNPPCATLNASGPFISADSIVVDFNWQTSCNHIIPQPNCPNNATSYKFLFRVADDYCHVPSYKIVSVTIVVKSISTIAPTVIFDGVYLNSSLGLTYTWFVDGILLPNDTLQSIIPMMAGIYTVQVMDTNLCTNTSIPNIVTSISQISKELAHVYKIYPNPANEYFIINGNEKIIELNAYSIFGQKINLLIEKDKVDISMMSQGFYTIEIKGYKHNEHIKLLKL